MPLLVRVTFVYLLVAVAVGALVWSNARVWRAQSDALRQVYEEDRFRQLEEVIALLRQRPETLAYDYSWWDAMVAFVATADPVWGRENLDEVVDSIWGVQAAWVLQPDGQLVYSYEDLMGRHGIELPVPWDQLVARAAVDPFARFAVWRGNTLWECFLAPIHSDMRERDEAPLEGWFLVGRVWDDALRFELAEVTQMQIDIVRHDHSARGHRTLARHDDHEIVVHSDSLDTHEHRVAAPELFFHVPFRDVAGHTIAVIEAELFFPVYGQIMHLVRVQSRLLLLSVALVLGLALLLLYRWVNRPLRRVIGALRDDDEAQIEPLAHQGDEFGLVARSLQGLFAKRREARDEAERRRQMEEELRATSEQLVRNMDARERLNRDLHDGVLQSLYAVGLQVDRLARENRERLPEATDQLKLVRGTLQETIETIRGFLNQPAHARDEAPIDLAVALRHLAHSVSASYRATVEVEILVGETNQWDPRLRHTLLFIAQELLSNTFRHGLAKRVIIVLQYLGKGMIELRLTSDGEPYDLEVGLSAGRGLHNIQERAREFRGTFRVTQTAAGLQSSVVTLRYDDLNHS